MDKQKEILPEITTQLAKHLSDYLGGYEGWCATLNGRSVSNVQCRDGKLVFTCEDRELVLAPEAWQKAKEA